MVHNHYQNRDAIDSHNARRQAPIALEETWATSRWANRVFAYLLATTEVNTNLGQAAFGANETARPQLEFRRLLVRDLINNHYRTSELQVENLHRSQRIARQQSHELVHLPAWKKHCECMPDYWLAWRVNTAG